MNEEKNKIVYFPHDTNASNDPKLIHLRMSFGWKAIGMYWAIIEALHKEESGNLPKHIIKSMILDFYSQEEIREMRHILEEAETFEESLYANALLVLCDGITTSKRVKENINKIETKSNSARNSALKRWGKETNIKQNNNDANAMRTLCERNARKEKKRKENILADKSAGNLSKELLDYFFIRYKQLTGKEPIITSWARYNKQSKPFVEKYGIEKMKEAVELYFESEDNFIKNNGYPINIFLTDNTLQKLWK